MKILNKKGVTLIELVVTLAILGLVATVAYPMLNFTYKTANEQLEKSNERNEIRVVSTHLKNDIEYSKDIELIDSSSLRIINKDNETINYYIQGSGSKSHLVRNKGVSVAFRNINDVEFKIVNDHLVQAKLFTDYEKNEATEFKIYRWEMIIERPQQEDDIKTIIVRDKIFVLVNEVAVNGSSTIKGPNATVIVKNDAEYKGGGVQYIDTKNIYFEGGLSLDKGAGIGKSDGSSSIYINGDCTVEGDSRLIGTSIIKGNLNLSSPNLKGSIYVDGNIDISGGSYEDFKSMPTHIYYTGTLSKPNYYGSIPATKVPAIEDIVYPKIDIPSLQPDIWYANKGYSSNSALKNNMRFLGSSLSFQDWGENTFNDVSIVSKGDITLKGNVHVTGILFAPNGQVTIDGNSTFKGLILAKNIVVSGNSHVTFQPIGIDDLPF